ncbi:hypothetical protein [Lacisediminimonas sp.]|uniref:hypothetical protein n=1 Tax=Lacisediminimonas sp. TaxID=3060582 RepID=UPI002728578F|nr:hypothetical protein [Lacisediminimonas sp.]MDO8299507.1 hypothetical protein [Lacisediminimonas sp.]
MHLIEEVRQPPILPEPLLAGDGVCFCVTVEQHIRSCLVTSEALRLLAQEHGFSMDAMNTYFAFEAKISSTARSLVFRGATSYPLVLGPDCFH